MPLHSRAGTTVVVAAATAATVVVVAAAVAMRVGGGDVDGVGGAAAGVADATVAIGVVLHELHSTGHSFRYCAASASDKVVAFTRVVHSG